MQTMKYRHTYSVYHRINAVIIIFLNKKCCHDKWCADKQICYSHFFGFLKVNFIPS